ncbi:hypothetical protein RB596_006226 [Gaeumannomyces avenae]
MSDTDEEPFGVMEDVHPDKELLRQILPQRPEGAITALRSHIDEDDELVLRSGTAGRAMATTAPSQASGSAAQGIEELSQAMLDDRHRRHRHQQARQQQSRQIAPPPPPRAGAAYQGTSGGSSVIRQESVRSRSTIRSRAAGNASNSPAQARHRQEAAINERGLPPPFPSGPIHREPAARLSRQVVQKSDGTIIVPRRNSSSLLHPQIERLTSPGARKLKPRDDTGGGPWEELPTRAEIEAAKKILQRLVMNGGGTDGTVARGASRQPHSRGHEQEVARQDALPRTTATPPPVQRQRRVIKNDSDDDDESDGNREKVSGGYHVIHMDENHHARYSENLDVAAAGHQLARHIIDGEDVEEEDMLASEHQSVASGASQTSQDMEGSRCEPRTRTPVLDHLRLYSDAAPAPPIPDVRPASSHDSDSSDGDSDSDSVDDDEVSRVDHHHHNDHYDDHGPAHYALSGHWRGSSDDYGVPSITQHQPASASGDHESLDYHRQRQPSSSRQDVDLHKSFSREPPGLTSSQSGVSESRRTDMPVVTGGSRMPDFFGPSLFQVVLKSPTTAYQLQMYCESRFCDENMEFLQHIDFYHYRLNKIINTMTDIHNSYISDNSPRQVNLQSSVIKQLHRDMSSMVSTTLPSMESLFANAQESVRNLIYSDVYPGFVRHQLALSASRALAEDKSRYQGLGDCFCLTDPGKPQNPILWASEGFVAVTGYTRTEIIPRNCRFLQGAQTDPEAVKRLSMAIHERKETVELLLNYKKNKEPFWNLLYCAPLYDEAGELAFFIGGQVNCSTTIHSSADVMRVLSMSAGVDYVQEMKEKERQEQERARTHAKLAGIEEKDMTTNGAARKTKGGSARRALLRALGVRLGSGSGRRAPVEESNPLPAVEKTETGMEQQVLERMEGQELDAQKKEFYTAYSKYLVIDKDFVIRFYSAGITGMLCSANNSTGSIAGTDVFTLLQNNGLSRRTEPEQHQHPRGNAAVGGAGPEYKGKVRAALIGRGNPISIELRLQTRRSAAFGGYERFAAHWTPLKDDAGKVGWVVLTLGNVMM